MKPTIVRKVYVSALIATVVVAWSLSIPLAMAPPPDACSPWPECKDGDDGGQATATVTLGPNGALVTVGDSCEGVTSKPTTATPVDVNKVTGKGNKYISTGPVAIWFDFTVSYERHDGEILTLPGCLVANRMRDVEFEDGTLVFVRLSNIDTRTWEEGGITHSDRFGFHASDYDKDGTFDSVMKYGCRHKGKYKYLDIDQDIVFQGDLEITGSLS